MAKPFNLLLVEDDSAVREALTKALTVENHLVHGAANAAEAVEVCTRTKIDFVILDLNLGAEDGWNLFHEIKENHPELPIVVTSGERARLAHPSAELAAGALEKPFDVTALLGLLESDQPSPQAPRKHWPRFKKAAAIAGGVLLSICVGRSASALVPSPIQITHLTVTNGMAVVEFQGGGATNQVQSIDALGSTNWVDLDVPTTSHSVTSICTAPMTFYRVASFSNSTGDTTAPSTPTGLMATLRNCTQVDLSWSASSDSGANATGVQGYYIYRNSVFLKKVQGTTYSDNGLTPSTAYSYQVCAVDRARNVSGKTSLASVNTGSCNGACQYSLTLTSAAAAASGGIATVGVNAGSGCYWTAVSTVSWITVTAGDDGTGSATVQYSVAGNASTSPRSGTLNIAGQVLTVTQAAASGGPVGPDSTAPTVTFALPSSGSSISGSATVTANVSDNVGVSTVQFYVDNLGAWVLFATKTGTGANANYSQSLDTSTLANGAHNLLVRGYDAAGNSSYSLLGVTVNNYNADPGILSWAKDMGQSAVSGGSAQCSGITIDSQGNQIVVGIYNVAATIGGTAETTQGGYDFYVAKYSVGGTLQWIRTYGGGNDNIVSSVAVDSADNIIVTGEFMGSMSAGGTIMTSAGGASYSDVFVAKYSASGAHIWSKRFGGAYGNYANRVMVDKNNDIFVAGLYNFQTDFGGGAVQSAGGADGYVVKFSGQSGGYIWAHSFGGANYDDAEGLAVDGNGDVVVSGYSTGSMDFGGGVRVSGGGADGFLAKFSGSTGNHIWSKMIGGLGNEDGIGVGVDGSGNGVLVGSFTQTINIGGVSLSAPLSTAMLILRFDAAGNFAWAKAVGGVSSIGGIVGPKAVAVDNAGNIVITGNVTGEADFGSGQIGSGTGNIFMAKYSPTGGYLWDKRFVGSGWNSAAAIAIDGARNIYGTGTFAGMLDFAGTQLNTLNTLTKDAYIVRISP
jgi:CheY-like chemotaxis protein